MSDRLFVGVLGNRNSGKSITWNTLFGSTVKTGTHPRKLDLYDSECVEVFLISGSFEERQLYAGDVLDNQDSRIILCSIQYTKEVYKTLYYVEDKGFDVFVQWLNPGYNDDGENYDNLGLMPWFLGHGATVSMRDGTVSPILRTEEIRQYIYGWSRPRGIIFSC
ncbi:hypothetical protein [Oceanibaculum indicum]|uniref:G domain-containing protein n=1 Tax=Oceanibaculum indicum TaxID=526216 RepID=A0A420WNB9_9PROT|nr:hypothetical protein [Oceanibaculum indicum]RKQ72509.1 hypothetical protein BCL74_0277 [Oceanibaculum indicum]